MVFSARKCRADSHIFRITRATHCNTVQNASTGVKVISIFNLITFPIIFWRELLSEEGWGQDAQNVHDAQGALGKLQVIEALRSE